MLSKALPRILLPGLLWAAVAVVRAQVTETPHPVAPGRLIVEMDGVNLELDRRREDGGSFSGLGVANTLLSAGLTDSVDLQVGATVLVRQRFETAGLTRTHAGLGELVFRSKVRVWNEPSWPAALALLPYVRVPSRVGSEGGRRVEFGLIVPWETAVPAGFTLGAMAQWDLQRGEGGQGHTSRWSASAVLQRPLLAGLKVYAEGAVAAGADRWTRPSGQLGAGVAWQASKVLEVEYELLRGLNQRSTDWQHVLRLNWSWKPGGRVPPGSSRRQPGSGERAARVSGAR